MPPSGAKANYKSYEAQARMVRAIVAAHPEVKWNYKEIVACYGSDMTDHALNHRFRRLRSQALIIRYGREQGLDMKDLSTDDKDLPSTQDTIDTNNIAKYFGQSTPDGIGFQFRGIKKDAEMLRQAAIKGEDVASCLDLGSGTSGTAPMTPSKQTPFRQALSRASTGKRSRTTPVIKTLGSSDDDIEDIDDFSELDQTPSKRPKATARGGRKTTPSRKAAVRADSTIAEAAAVAQMPSSGEPLPPEIDLTFHMPAARMAPAPAAPVRAQPSIFGDVDVKPSIAMPAEPTIRTDYMHHGLDNFGDAYFGDSTKFNEYSTEF